jgi:imidazolonepropionase
MDASPRSGNNTVQIFENAAQIVTCGSTDESCVLENAAFVVVEGHIADVGHPQDLARRYAGATHVDCSGCVITPGFIDSHTHTVFGNTRAAEYAMRSRGVPYMEIARRGGGINASVRDVRTMSEQELGDRTRARLAAMLRQGTTTAEIKSGYGLSTEAELKQLRVIRTLSDEGWDVIPTFLGGHEFPAEFRDRRDDYVKLLTDEMIPAVASQELAVFCDVFCEPGVFTPEQTRTILDAGRKHGLVPKLHADELENSGAAELAADVGAASADHLAAISDRGIDALAHSDTVATLLPTTMLFLGKKNYAPARRLIDAGATVALATDFNPGSSPTHNMQLVLTLACSQMGMDPLEAIVAATAGAARALQLRDRRGTITNGAPADLIVWDVSDYEEIPYHFGAAPIRTVYKAGAAVS